MTIDDDNDDDGKRAQRVAAAAHGLRRGSPDMNLGWRRDRDGLGT